ncbi:glycosyltransferase family 32 protein [Clostridium butyricum]|uniref:glycosyltransferase family 32 protein n=1 Tax=Clostridium butyricum TaxID=1492 RepID=UPI003D348E69
MIPKKIHYCWFGGAPLSDLNKKCIESWKKFCPDYEIIEWNEKNFDLHCCSYVKEAYEAKKWAFASDYVRLYIIYKYGGIYLDTDVELIKPLDHLLEYECFLGTEEMNVINTGLGFGAKANNEHVKLMLNEYSNLHFKISENVYDFIPCPQRNTLPFLKLGYIKENRIQKIGNTVIYPTEYFCPLNFETKELKITKNTISIHHFNGSWITDEEKQLTKKIEMFKKKHGRIISFIYKNYAEYKFQYKKFSVKFFIEFVYKKIYKKFYIKNMISH